jgi:hypothetical protein
MGEPRW